MVRTSSITMPSMVGIVGRASAVDEKVRCFFICLSVTLWNYKVCDNGNAMKQYYYQNNYVSLHARRFVLVHLYSNFSVGPPNFSTGANLYQKLRFFAIFAVLGPHF